MTACTVCVEHGRWPANHIGTHCRDCHDSWSSLNAAHTLCCHRTFKSNNAADLHLIRGVCTDPATIPGFELVERAHGYRCWTQKRGLDSALTRMGRETTPPGSQVPQKRKKAVS